MRLSWEIHEWGSQHWLHWKKDQRGWVKIKAVSEWSRSKENLWSLWDEERDKGQRIQALRLKRSALD